MKAVIFFLIFGLFGSVALALETEAIVDVSLNPIGSFKAKTNDVKGTAHAVGDGYSAENIIVNLKDLKTGISLRDEHMQNKYLEVDKYPEAVLLHAEGKAGQGKGRIKIHGVEKDIAGSYEIKDGFLTANFPLKISDFEMKEVNYKGVGAENEVQVHITVPLKAVTAVETTKTESKIENKKKK